MSLRVDNPFRALLQLLNERHFFARRRRPLLQLLGDDLASDVAFDDKALRWDVSVDVGHTGCLGEDARDGVLAAVARHASAVLVRLLRHGDEGEECVGDDR